MNFKYIFAAGLIFGTGFGLMGKDLDKNIKKRIIGVFQSGISGSLMFGGWSLFVLGLTSSPNS